MSKDVTTLSSAALSDDASSSSSCNSDVSLRAPRERRFLSLSNRRTARSYHGISGCRSRRPHSIYLNKWCGSPLFTASNTGWSDRSDFTRAVNQGKHAGSEDVENQKPNNSDLLTVPVNTSTPIVTDTVESDTSLVNERVVKVREFGSDWNKSAEATQSPLRTAPSLILPADDEAEDLEEDALSFTELPIDPYKRARKFLYRLAPLLKLSLPSRVERKRAASVFECLQTQSGNGTLTVPYSSRASPWIRQWMKHGVMVHHCITFSGTDPSDPGTQAINNLPSATTNSTVLGPCLWSSTGPHVALSNADYYVQDLWRELQLRLHGPLFMEELRKRRAFANTVMQRIVSFSMQPTEPDAVPSQIAQCTTHASMEQDVGIDSLNNGEADSCSVSSNYLTLLMAASKSVSQLLRQTDHVEQAWSSDARLVSEFSDWALPEVRCRLVCLRQWCGTLTSLQRGMYQLCEFLHCPTSTKCAAHMASVRQTTELPVLERDLSVHELSSCTTLRNRNKPGERSSLYREFLKGSWLMPPLPSHLLTNKKATANNSGNSTNAPHSSVQASGPPAGLNDLTTNPNWGGLSMALVRLDRLVGRLLLQVTDNLTAASSPSQAKNVLGQVISRSVNHPAVMKTTATPTQTIRRVAPPSLNQPSTQSTLSPRKQHTPLMASSHLAHGRTSVFTGLSGLKRDHSVHPLLPTATNHSSVTTATPVDDSRELTRIDSANALQASLTPSLRSMEPRRVASYAEIVKRRSWCDPLSPHLQRNALHQSTDMQPVEERTPGNWEICSPAPSLSPYARTPLSSSTSPSASPTPSSDSPSRSRSSHSSNSSSALTSDRSLKSSSLSAIDSSKSPHISSSNSSLPSMLRPRCAVAASPTSAESCASLLSVDLCNRSSLARPQPPSPPPADILSKLYAADNIAPASGSLPSMTQFPTTTPCKSETRPTISSSLPYRPKDLATELGLPTLVPLWLFLAQVPFDMALEAVTMKLEQYDERVLGTTQCNKVSLDHLVNELRELLFTALQITVTFRKRLVAALRLDTMAQIRTPFNTSTSMGPRRACPLLRCMHSESESDSGLPANIPTGTPPGRWPQWFRRATHQVRAFLDSNPIATAATAVNVSGPHPAISARPWPVSLPMLLDVYVDCFVRLIDGQCWVGEGDPSVLRSRIENEWNFLRRLYRQLYRCRGGLQYFSMRNASLAVKILPPTAEAAFIRACQRFLGLISKQLCPAIGDWCSTAVAMCTRRVSTRSDTCPVNNLSSTQVDNWSTNNCSVGDRESSPPHQVTGWTSPQPPVPSICPNGTSGGGGSLRTEVFQEFNEIWREVRSWLNCLLDLTGVMCGDLDTSSVLNFYVPRKSVSKTGSVLSTRLVYDCLASCSPEPAGPLRSAPSGMCSGFSNQLSVDSETGDSRSRAYARLARELRRTGHVLLYAWDQPKPDAMNSDTETNPSMGCIFIWSPLLQPNVFSDGAQQGNNPCKFSADSTSGDPFDRYHAHEDRGLIIASPEQRRAVRFHVSELVHRILRQLIFKFRKHCTPSTPGLLTSMTARSKPGHRQARYNFANASRIQPGFSGHQPSTPGNGIKNDNKDKSNSPTNNPNNVHMKTNASHNNATCATGNGIPMNKINLLPVSKSHTEYLLVCPEFPERMWDGLVYRFSGNSDGPAQSRSTYSRRLRYALSWLALMSTRGSLAPLFTSSVDLSNLITCHLLAEKPYSAWTMLCEGSTRLRRWLSMGLTQMKSAGFDRSDEYSATNATSAAAQQNQPDGSFGNVYSPTNACILHLAPIHPDLGVACVQLHKSLCDLSARLHASILVMDSHLRGFCETYADESERTLSRRSSSTNLDHSRSFEPYRLRSVSPRRSTSRELTAHALSGDALQRAYSVVFGFHKTLMRLMATAPLTNTLQNDDVTTLDNLVPNLPIQTRLVNLGVQLLASWSRFVTGRYQRGRGRIPRWANDACHFAYQLCQPRSVTFLEARKVASLEATLNDLIPHLVGEDKSTDGNSLSPVLSRLSPISVHESIDKPLFARCNSSASSHSFQRQHRRVSSMHSDTQSKRALSVAPRRPSWRQTTASVGKQGGSLDSELMKHLGFTCDNSTAFDIIYQLDTIRDDRLRQVGLIGRPRPLNGEQNAAGESDVEIKTDTRNDRVVSPKSPVPRLTRRKFPYAWNRGRLIGRGITGEVFQAFNLQTQEMMAVKEIRFDYDTFADADGTSTAAALASSDCPRQRTALLRQQREAQARLHSFRRECDLLSSLSHPALVRFLGADEQTPKVFRLFTELCTAGTLADVVRDRLPEALVRRYARDLARAVAYLHDRGIVHRDIKPANIFLVGSINTSSGLSSTNMAKTSINSTGTRPTAGSVANEPTQDYSLLKLGDFSHALRLHSLSNSCRDGEIREVAGTVCYMAPEVCQSQSRGLDTGYGRPCDIWSYCCVLLELITGRQPWHGYRDSLAIFYRLCRNQTPALPPVYPNIKNNECENGSVQKDPAVDGLPYASEEAVALLRAGIQPDPARRPTAADLFQFEFVHCPVSYLSHIELAHSR